MKVLVTVACVLVILLLGVTLMKQLGLEDVVEDVGTTVRQKTRSYQKRDGRKKNSLDVSSSNKQFAKEVIGWDITQLKSKPVETIEEGIRRLDEMIADLNAQYIKAGKKHGGDRRVYDDNREKREQVVRALTAITPILGDETAQYPQNINGVTYSSRASLFRQYEKLKSKKRELDDSAEMIGNGPGVPEDQMYKLQEKINLARSLRGLLDARLRWAHGEEADAEIDKLIKKVDDLLDTKEVIKEIDLPDEHPTMNDRIRRSMDQGF